MNTLNLFLTLLLSATVTTEGTHGTLPLVNGNSLVAVQVLVPAGWDYADRVLVIVNGQQQGAFALSPFRRRCETFAVTVEAPKTYSVIVEAQGKRKPWAWFSVKVKE